VQTAIWLTLTGVVLFEAEGPHAVTADDLVSILGTEAGLGELMLDRCP
jgi:hypothetical protein